MLRFALFLAALLALALPAAADDDRFDSENKAQTVRPPVLAGGKPFTVPFTIAAADLDGQTTVAASNVKAITELEGKDALIVGTVVKAFVPKGGTKVILNFGKDYKTCFNAVIDDADYKKWGKKKESAEEIGKMYAGKRVAVGGVVSRYQDNPQVLVTLPHQLSVIDGK
ncbi:MAG: hypothetical protein ACRC7O_07485 [Fimbriiglobus sp.]